MKTYDIVINKKNKLNNNYIPSDLKLIKKIYTKEKRYVRKKVKYYFEKMAKKLKKNKLNIFVISAYRSYSYQKNLYEYYVKEKGIKYADECCAKAGYSEHQTGLAIDIANINLDYDNFDKTKEFIWMINNSYKYGFILRYPKGKENITGYKYEPWHYRFVGIKLAKYLYKNNLTLEEYKKSS